MSQCRDFQKSELEKISSLPLHATSHPLRQLDGLGYLDGRAVRNGMSAPFVVHEGRDGLALFGEVDIATCPTLNDALQRAISNKAADLVLDCSGVTFFGAAGVGALISARLQLDGSGHRLVVMRPSPIVRRILEVLELTQLFHVVAGECAR